MKMLEMLLRKSKPAIALLITLTTFLVPISLCLDQSDSPNYSEQRGYLSVRETNVEKFLQIPDLGSSSYITEEIMAYNNKISQGKLDSALEDHSGFESRMLSDAPPDWPRWRDDDDEQSSSESWSSSWQTNGNNDDNKDKYGKNSDDEAKSDNVRSDDELEEEDKPNESATSGSNEDQNDEKNIIVEEVESTQIEEMVVYEEEVPILVEETLVQFEEAEDTEIVVTVEESPVEESVVIPVENISVEEEFLIYIEEEEPLIEEQNVEHAIINVEVEFIDETSLIIILFNPIEEEPETNMELEMSNEEGIIIVEDEDFLQTEEDAACSNSSAYYFPNGTCRSDCPSQTFIKGMNLTSGHKTCTPCDPSCATCAGRPDYCTACSSKFPYFFLNQTCQKSCPSETNQLVQLKGNTVCMSKNSTIAYKDQSNATNVTTPEQKRVIEIVHSYNSATGTIVAVSIATAQILNKGSCSTAPAILLINLINYIKYLDICYPPKLIGIFQNQVEDLISFDFLPSFPDAGSPKVVKYKAPERFSRYQVNGLFIVNFWEEIFTSLVLGLLALLIKFLLKRFIKHPLIRKLLDWVESFLVWNFMITFLLSNLGDAVLYSIIEFRSLKLDGGLAVVSFLTNLVFIIGYLALLVYTFVKLYRLRNKQNFKSNKEKAESNPRIRILFEDLNNKSLLQEILVSITSFKVILSSLIISTIDAPVVQTVFLLLLNIAMIAYLIIYKPLVIRRKNVEIIVYEALMFIGSAACIHFAVQDPSSQETDFSTENTIIVINLILISFVLLFQVLDVGIEIKKFISEFRETRKSEKVHPVTESEDKASTNIKPLESNTTEENQDVKLDIEKLRASSLKVLTTCTELRRHSSAESQVSDGCDNTALTRITSNNLLDPSPKSGLTL